MNQVTRYMARQIFWATLVSTISLSLAVMLVQSVRLVDLIVNNGLSFVDFASMALLALPRYLPMILPLTLFGSVLFTYNRMINDSELVILRAAGMSRAALAKPGLIVGLLFVMVSYSLTLYFSPVSYSSLRTKLLQARSNIGSSLLKEGQFNKFGNDVTIFVREKNSLSDLRGVFIHNSRNPNNEITVIAERGAFIETDQGPRVVVLNGTQQSTRDGKTHVLQFDRSTVDLGIETSPTGKRWVDPQERFLPDLFNPDLTDPSNRQHYATIIAEGHKRLVSPLLCLMCALIAMATILNGGFSRRGHIRFILLASGLAILFYASNIMLTTAAPRSSALIPLLYANALLPVFAGVFFLLRPVRYKTPALDMTEA